MSRLPRKQAVGMGELIQMWLKDSHLTSGMNTHIIFSAWDEASGAGAYTVRRFYRDGKLYITLNSSVVRTQLGFQRDALIEKINSIISRNELFCTDDKYVGAVRELILK